jgi:integrase
LPAKQSQEENIMAKKKLPTIRTRQRGKTWSYMFEAGRHPNGKRRTIEKGGFATQKDALEAGMEAYTNLRYGDIGITSEKILLSDYLISWIDNIAVCNVRPSTISNYHTARRLWIDPYFTGKNVQDIRPVDIDCWMRTLLKKGFSRSTLDNARTVLRQALDYAVYPAELIRSNPSASIKVPRLAPTGIIKRTVIPVEKFRQLLQDNPFGTCFYMPIMLLYYTGMRISEVLGLAWEDIDLEQGTISLSRQLLASNTFSQLKTAASARTIIIDKKLCDELRRWKSKQASNELFYGGSYIYTYKANNDALIQQSKGVPLDNPAARISLVCTQENGRVLCRVLLNRYLKAQGLNCHSFRHTHATMLIENGATPKGVAGRLGHSKTSITQDLYTHNTQKLQQETANIFSHAMQTK